MQALLDFGSSILTDAPILLPKEFHIILSFQLLMEIHKSSWAHMPLEVDFGSEIGSDV